MTDSEIAVALRHDPEAADLPRVSASGRGAIARRIVEIARANRIEVRRDADLAGMLQALEIDSPIPLAAFAAVAEILARLYRANGALAEGGR
jgi:flagellar biosynthesis protein